MDSQSFPYQTQEDEAPQASINVEEGIGGNEEEFADAVGLEGDAEAGAYEGEVYEGEEEDGAREDDDEVQFVGSVPAEQGGGEEGAEYEEEGEEGAEEEEGEEEEYDEEEEEGGGGSGNAAARQAAAERDAYAEQFALQLVNNACAAGEDQMWNSVAIGRLIALIAVTQRWNQRVHHLMHLIQSAQLPPFTTDFWNALNEQVVWVQGRDMVRFCADTEGDGSVLAALLVDLVRQECLSFVHAGAADELVRVCTTHPGLADGQGGLEVLKESVEILASKLDLPDKDEEENQEMRGQHRALVLAIARGVGAEDKEKFFEMLPLAKELVEDEGKVISIDSDEDETGGAAGGRENGHQAATAEEEEGVAMMEGEEGGEYVEEGGEGEEGAGEEGGVLEEAEFVVEEGEEGGGEVVVEVVGAEVVGVEREGLEVVVGGAGEGREGDEGLLAELPDESNGLSKNWGIDGAEEGLGVGVGTAADSEENGNGGHAGEEGECEDDAAQEPVYKKIRISDEAEDGAGLTPTDDSTEKFYAAST